MSELKTKLSQVIKEAMKAKRSEELTVARGLHAAIRQIEIDEKIEVNDEKFVEIILFQIKKRQDAIRQFEAGHRMDLADNEKREVEFLRQFLPEGYSALNEDEVKNLIKKVSQEIGATSMKDMKNLMATLLPHVEGRADPKQVGQWVRESLSK